MPLRSSWKQNLLCAAITLCYLPLVNRPRPTVNTSFLSRDGLDQIALTTTHHVNFTTRWHRAQAIPASNILILRDNALELYIVQLSLPAEAQVVQSLASTLNHALVRPPKSAENTGILVHNQTYTLVYTRFGTQKRVERWSSIFQETRTPQMLFKALPYPPSTITLLSCRATTTQITMSAL